MHGRPICRVVGTAIDAPRAACDGGYLRTVPDWVVHLLPARWWRLMRAGEREWPVGPSRPFADAGTLLLYAMGESAFSEQDRPRS